MSNRPKRRKFKDNPYTIIEIEISNKYFITFKDSRGIFNKVEVSKDIYELFNYYELRDLSQMNEYDNHIEYSEIYENNLNKRAIKKEKSIEEIILEKFSFNELKKAIEELPEIQKQRIKKYYFKIKMNMKLLRKKVYHIKRYILD